VGAVLHGALRRALPGVVGSTLHALGVQLGRLLDLLVDDVGHCLLDQLVLQLVQDVFLRGLTCVVLVFDQVNTAAIGFRYAFKRS
jgi:hypothetical protein